MVRRDKAGLNFGRDHVPEMVVVALPCLGHTRRQQIEKNIGRSLSLQLARVAVKWHPEHEALVLVMCMRRGT